MSEREKRLGSYPKMHQWGIYTRNSEGRLTETEETFSDKDCVTPRLIRYEQNPATIEFINNGIVVPQHVIEIFSSGRLILEESLKEILNVLGKREIPCLLSAGAPIVLNAYYISEELRKQRKNRVEEVLL